MSWFDLLVKLAPPSAMDRARQIAAEQRAAANDKRRRALLKESLAAPVATGRNPDKSVARRPIGVRSITGDFALLDYRAIASGSELSYTITPVGIGASAVTVAAENTPIPAPEEITPGLNGVPNLGVGRFVGSRVDLRHMILPYRRDSGILVICRSTSWGAAEYRLGRWFLVDTHPTEVNAENAEYRWSWVADDAYQNLTPPDPVPFAGSMTSSSAREILVYYFNTSNIREIDPPATLTARLEGIFKLHESAVNRGGNRNYIVGVTNGPDQPTIGQILASPYVQSPDILIPGSPWRTANTAITGYGIQNIYQRDILGWGSGVYSYLDGSYPPITPGTTTEASIENLAVDDAAVFLGSLGIAPRWAHQFDEAANRGLLYELTGAPLAGSIESLATSIPRELWQRSTLALPQNVDYRPNEPTYAVFTDIVDNRFPDYNTSKLIELGFDTAQL